MRNWKERWNPDAEFVYNKRLRMSNDPVNPWAMPGDPVDKMAIGIRRLRRWWDAGIIRLDKERIEAPKPRILRITKNCYEVRVPGKRILRFNTKPEADQALRLLLGQPKKSSEEIYIEKVNKLMWAVHVPGQPVEKIKGQDKAIQRLHEVARG